MHLFSNNNFLFGEIMKTIFKTIIYKIDMILNKEKYEKRNQWFKFYVESVSKQKEWQMFKGRFICPCCKMPTLEERTIYDICSICFWEDDGQDSDDADNIRGGPNGSYSLTEARSNFEKYFTMYRPEDKRPFERESKTRTERTILYNAYKKAIATDSDIDFEKALQEEENYNGRYDETNE